MVAASFVKPSVERRLDWLETYIQFFEPFAENNKPNENKLRALAELALLCLHLQRCAALEVDRRVQCLLGFIAEIYARPLFEDRLFRIGDTFMAHALFRAALYKVDIPDETQKRAALQKLVIHSNVTLKDLAPHLVLELRHLLDLCRFCHNLPSYSALYRSSLLAKPLNLIYATNFDAYCITHILFYLSDFSFRPILGIPKGRIDDVAWMVEHLLGMYIRVENWDLVAELLLACHCIGRTDSNLWSFGWEALRDAQWDDGMVPGPYYDARSAEELRGVKKRQYFFDHCYHTTLVTTLAGALCFPPSGTMRDGV